MILRMEKDAESHCLSPVVPTAVSLYMNMISIGSSLKKSSDRNKTDPYAMQVTYGSECFFFSKSVLQYFQKYVQSFSEKDAVTKEIDGRNDHARNTCSTDQKSCCSIRI